MEINSVQNTQIKNIVKLKKASERKKQGLFVVEGEREIKIAIDSGQTIETHYVCARFNKNKEKLRNAGSISVSEDVFRKISYRESPDGNIATFKLKRTYLKDANLSKKPLIIILESIEKPGNLGAIMRTADAAKIDAVIVNNSKIDIYNPNAIRASQGTIFSTPLFLANIKETEEFCINNKISIFATSPRANKNYTEADFSQGSAILMGSEDIGLSDEWLKLANQSIKIEMKGLIDSLNLSVSTAVIVFEVLRQRADLSPID
ncbi:MAG: RNA methyltransferase [Patescibacteria group bacterium]|jgi:TrmH family RNA methyltransferase|nr:RNA methyltransferase [Patescibacteria group bacterium]